MKGRIILIFIIITILMSSYPFSVVSQNCEMYNLKKYSKPSGIIPRIFIRATVVGNARSGKQLGNISRIGIIEFDYVKFYIIRIFPLRVDIIEKKNVTTILFGIDQEIPEGPFLFTKDMVFFAIVF